MAGYVPDLDRRDIITLKLFINFSGRLILCCRKYQNLSWKRDLIPRRNRNTLSCTLRHLLPRAKSGTIWKQRWFLNNFIRFVSSTLSIQNSKFHRFHKLRNFWDFCFSSDIDTVVPENRHIHTNRHEDSKSVVYLAFSPTSKVSYIGSTTKGLLHRSDEHLKNLCLPRNPEANKPDIPWYFLGLRGDSYIFCPLISFSQIDRTSLYLVERRLQNLLQPLGCTPWIYSNNKSFSVGSSSTHLIELNKNQIHRSPLREKHRLRSSPSPVMFGSTMDSEGAPLLWQLTPFEIAVRLSDPRRPEEGLKRKLRSLTSFEIDKILKIATKRFSGISQKTILSKIATARCLRSWDHTNDNWRTIRAKHYQSDFSTRISIKLPYIKGINLVHSWISNFKKYLCPDAVLTTGESVLLTIKNVMPPTIKDFLNNETRIHENIGRIDDGHCGCKILYNALSMFETESKFPTGLYKDTNGHFAAKLLETELWKTCMPDKCTSTVRMIPNEGWFLDISQKVGKHLSRVGGPNIRKAIRQANSRILDEVATVRSDHFDSTKNGTPSIFNVESIFRMLKTEKLICAEIDKAKEGLSVRCRLGHSLALTKAIDDSYNEIEDLNLSSAYTTIENTIVRFRDQNNYKPTPKNKRLLLKVENHPDDDWGILKIRTKISAYCQDGLSLLEKFRPLVPYYNHQLKALFKACCRAGPLLLSKVGSDINSMDHRRILLSFHQFDKSIISEDLNTQKVRMLMYKYDIENFYGNVVHSDIKCAFGWMVSRSNEALFRTRNKKFIKVPKTSFVSIRKLVTISTHTNWKSDGTLRPISTPHNKPCEFRNVAKIDSSKDIYLSRKDIYDLINIDLELMFTRKGSVYLKQKTGVPQGSPIGPFLACLCATFYGFRIGVMLSTKFNPLTKCIMRRWIDDTYCIIVAPIEFADEVEDIFFNTYNNRLRHF